MTLEKQHIKYSQNLSQCYLKDPTLVSATNCNTNLIRMVDSTSYWMFMDQECPTNTIINTWIKEFIAKNSHYFWYTLGLLVTEWVGSIGAKLFTGDQLLLIPVSDKNYPEMTSRTSTSHLMPFKGWVWGEKSRFEYYLGCHEVKKWSLCLDPITKLQSNLEVDAKQ